MIWCLPGDFREGCQWHTNSMASKKSKSETRRREERKSLEALHDELNKKLKSRREEGKSLAAILDAIAAKDFEGVKLEGSTLTGLESRKKILEGLIVDFPNLASSLRIELAELEAAERAMKAEIIPRGEPAKAESESAAYDGDEPRGVATELRFRRPAWKLYQHLKRSEPGTSRTIRRTLLDIEKNPYSRRSLPVEGHPNHRVRIAGRTDFQIIYQLKNDATIIVGIINDDMQQRPATAAKPQPVHTLSEREVESDDSLTSVEWLVEDDSGKPLRAGRSFLYAGKEQGGPLYADDDLSDADDDLSDADDDRDGGTESLRHETQ